MNISRSSAVRRPGESGSEVVLPERDTMAALAKVQQVANCTHTHTH